MNLHRSHTGIVVTASKSRPAYMPKAILVAAAVGTLTIVIGSQKTWTKEEAVSKSRLTVRGNESNREILLQCQVFDEDGKPASDCALTVNLRQRAGRKLLSPSRKGNQFEVWIPIGVSDWSYVDLHASSA